MTNGVPTRRELNDSLRTLLATATGRPIGVVRAPYKNSDVTQVADVPYAIIYPIVGGNFSGSPLFHPEEDAAFTYQVTSVGLRDDQAEWMADSVRVGLLGRGSDGNFVNAMTVPNMTVVMREPTGPPGGLTVVDRIFQVAESYRIWVSAAGS